MKFRMKALSPRLSVEAQKQNKTDSAKILMHLFVLCFISETNF